MGANVSTRKTRNTALASPLADFAGWELTACCPLCRDWRTLRVDQLLHHYGGHHRLSAIVNRLRCSVASCGRAPAGVTLRYRDGGREIVLV